MRVRVYVSPQGTWEAVLSAANSTGGSGSQRAAAAQAAREQVLSRLLGPERLYRDALSSALRTHEVQITESEVVTSSRAELVRLAETAVNNIQVRCILRLSHTVVCQPLRMPTPPRTLYICLADKQWQKHLSDGL